jgi:FKBP-type peptidyl-prolyl cis-trans isomerase FkpA
MKRVSFVMMLAVAMMTACSNEKETPSGQKYQLVRKGDGIKGKSGEYLVMEMVFKDAKDSVWNDTKKNELPVVMQVFDSAQLVAADGVMQVLQSLTKGDSVVFTVPAKKLFNDTWGQPVPPNVDTASLFTFHVAMSKIVNQEEFAVLQNEYQAKQVEKMQKDAEAQVAKDAALIEEHLAAKGIQALSTPSGLRYVMVQSGMGPNAMAGDVVSIHYAGFLLNGKCFDTSMEEVAKGQNMFDSSRAYAPYTLTAGQNSVIQGWEEAILLMNKGSKIKVFIPSGLAYGPRQRSADIGANEVLTFDMEMIDIKPAKR